MGDGTKATRARQLVWRQGTAKRLRAGDSDGGKATTVRVPSPPPPPPFYKSVGQLKGLGSLRATVSLISLL